MSDALEFVPWESFLPAMRWSQGEHVTLVGPTGSGKTTLALALLSKRDYVTVIGTKPKDRTLSEFARRESYTVSRTWPPKRPPSLEPRVVFWPQARELDARSDQRRTIHFALSNIYRAGAWCVVLDEIFFLANDLGLADDLKTFWTQGRALGLSIVGGTQRPRHIPLHAYSQASHLFFWRSADATDVKRLAEIGGSVDPKRVAYEISRLPRHTALYIDTIESRMLLTRVTID